MRRAVIAFVVVALVSLSACDTAGTQARSTARVVVGAALGDAVSTESVSRLGAPTDPLTGATGVVEAELTVFRSGNQVFYEVDGVEVDEVDGSPIFLTSAASDRTLTLYHGTYDFLVSARDGEEPANDLADGSVLDFVVSDDVSVTVPLLSFVGSAELSAPEIALPNQYFDVFLSVHPPGRTDLRVPTGDYYANYSFTGASSDLGHSNLGIRLLAVCDEIDLTAQVSRIGDEAPPDAVANRTIPVGFACPPVDGTVGIDLIPPYVAVTSHADGATVPHEAGVALSGEVNDAQSGVRSVEIYDGVVLVQSATITPPSGPGAHATWEADGFTASDERTYDLVVVATDEAGNQSHTTLQLVAAGDGS